MAFWSNRFMNDRRESFLNSLYKFQYKSNETWHDAVINSKRIEGLAVVITISLPRTGGDKETITAIRIIDSKGNECANQPINVVRLASQGVLIKFEFPIYEKEGV